MDPAIVRNEIEPLLSELIRELDAQGRATERAVYSRIRRSLRAADSPYALARPFHDLSTMAAVAPSRPHPAGDTHVLLARILQKAEQLALKADGRPAVH